MSRTGSCQSCQRIRWFLVAASTLLVGLFLQPEWLHSVAGLLPSSLTIGLGICGWGLSVFFFRLWQYKRAKPANEPRRSAG